MNHSIRELQKTIRRISAAHPRTNVLLGMHLMKIIGKRADPRRFALLMAKALEAHSRANMVAFSGNALNSKGWTPGGPGNMPTQCTKWFRNWRNVFRNRSWLSVSIPERLFV